MARVVLLALLLAMAAPVAAEPTVVRGTVKYLGKAPARRPVDRSSDPVCAKDTTPSEDVVVTGGTLRDIHVRLVGDLKSPPPTAPIVIEQSGCAYRPRVVGAIAGQRLIVKNADPTMHNVHAYQGDATAFNRSQPRG